MSMFKDLRYVIQSKLTVLLLALKFSVCDSILCICYLPFVGLCGLRNVDGCRISPSCFLAECHERRLNQASFVLLCFVLFAFSRLSLF